MSTGRVRFGLHSLYLRRRMRTYELSMMTSGIHISSGRQKIYSVPLLASLSHSRRSSNHSWHYKSGLKRKPMLF